MSVNLRKQASKFDDSGHVYVKLHGAWVMVNFDEDHCWDCYLDAGRYE